MPGILPMKVIKVGNSAQSRIAQACDRCRSKKIRCDGVRPTCSQCSNVGFECRTSDKLSRRAFPRGYTESLEERVRQLEAEVRELKDLVDEKDEKIDILSVMRGSFRGPSLSSHATSSPDMPKDVQPALPPNREDSFRIQGPPLLLGVENSDFYFMGSSSGRSFITTFKRKLQEAGRPCSDFNPEAFLHVQGCLPLTSDEPSPSARIPPRLFSDRSVNVYFQEWAPLFPVLHKPSFLRVYEAFIADPDKIKCNYKLAQLHLVFSIAGLSSDPPDLLQVAACEKQWTKALESLLLESTMSTLQCLILALIYCSIRADYKRLQHYKCIAVGLSHRLGLHQSQKRFSFGALTLETRKKVFWTLYTLDCFSAAALGLPKLLREEDVQAEYPSDMDDEYITEKGFQPTLPGEYTRLSSALALFRGSRILARVLERIYPASANHELSLHLMAILEGELDSWHAELPAHLRLNFIQDKPSPDVTSSRSPLIALAYFYIRTLIYRPAVGSTLGHRAAPALLSIAESSKHMIQIAHLLQERGMAFSICLNKLDVLAVCGITLLYQVIDLKQDSKLTRDTDRLVKVVVQALEDARASGSADLIRVSRSLVSADDQGASCRPMAMTKVPVGSAAGLRLSPPSRESKEMDQGQGRVVGGAAAELGLARMPDKMRRMTMPNVSAPAPELSDLYRTRLRQSFDSLSNDRSAAGSQDHCMPMGQPPCGGRGVSAAAAAAAAAATTSRTMPNLDYLSLSNTPSQAQSSPPGRAVRLRTPAGAPPPPPPLPPQGEPMLAHGADGAAKIVSTTEWEALLGAMDGGLNNVYDAIYGGASLINEASLSGNAVGSDWSPLSRDMGNFAMTSFGSSAGAPQSVPSIVSDESFSSGEEVAPSELGLSVRSADFHEQLSGGCGGGGTGSNEGFRLDGLEAYAL